MKTLTKPTKQVIDTLHYKKLIYNSNVPATNLTYKTLL